VPKVVEEPFSRDRDNPVREMPDHGTILVREAIRDVESPPQLRPPLPPRLSRARRRRLVIPNHGQHNRAAIPIRAIVKPCPEPAECRRRTVATAEA